MLTLVVPDVVTPQAVTVQEVVSSKERHCPPLLITSNAIGWLRLVTPVQWPVLGVTGGPVVGEGVTVGLAVAVVVGVADRVDVAVADEVRDGDGVEVAV